MKRKYIILSLVLLFSISLIFDNSISKVSDLEIKNILNSSFQWILFVGIVITGAFIFFKKYKIIPLIWSGLLISSVITWLLKFIIKRPRPFIEFTDVVLKTGYSFPSGHATVAFAALPFLEEKFPIFRWVWLTFIIIVVVMRVVTGIHYLSDVIAGALIGYSISSLIIFLNKKYRFINF